MENISPELKEDYERWRAKIGEDPYVGPKTVGLLDVLRAHYLVIDYFSTEYGEGVGGVGPRNLNLLHSTLSRQQSGFANVVKWNDDLQVCATLFWGLIKNHPFHDVNKRTALLTLFHHLIKVKRYPSAGHREYERLALRVASNALAHNYPRYEDFAKMEDSEIHFIADFLRRATRWMDKAEYRVTYRQLDGILRGFRHRLDNSDGNRISVMKEVDEPTGLVSTRKSWIRIGSIAFPGWNRQVDRDTVKMVRVMAKKTVKDGCDSEGFFHGADTLPVLIDEFQALLLRLSDK